MRMLMCSDQFVCRHYQISSNCVVLSTKRCLSSSGRFFVRLCGCVQRSFHSTMHAVVDQLVVRACQVLSWVHPGGGGHLLSCHTHSSASMFLQGDQSIATDAVSWRISQFVDGTARTNHPRSLWSLKYLWSIVALTVIAMLVSTALLYTLCRLTHADVIRLWHVSHWGPQLLYCKLCQ